MALAELKFRSDQIDLPRDVRTLVREADRRIEQFRGVFLKPLSNAQMQQFSPDQLEAFYKVGQEMPRSCAMLYALAQVQTS